MTTTTLFFPGAPSIDAHAEAEPWRMGAAGRGLDTVFVGIDRRGEPLTDIAARACALVEGSFRIVGVSGGAPAALATAALGGDRVERLMIVSGFPHPQHGLGVLAPTVDLEPDEARAWVRELLADAPIDDVEPYVESMVAELPHITAPWAFDVATITAPTTIFHSTDDDRCPVEGARWLAATIPGARYVEWPDGAHNAGFQHLDELYEAL